MWSISIKKDNFLKNVFFDTDIKKNLTHKIVIFYTWKYFTSYKEIFNLNKNLTPS